MPEPAPHTGTRWKIGLGLLVGIFLVATAASMVTAARRVSRVVDTDYYAHGLHYGETQDGTRNAGLGWTLTPHQKGGGLQVRVSDRSGAPVAGGRLLFLPREAAGEHRPLELPETAPGLFTLERPAGTPAELRGTLRFTRGDATASRQLVFLN